MLILTRKVGEAIIIDGDIEVTVLGIKEGQAKIGVTAPKDVSVDREEIHLKKQAERGEGKTQ